MKQENENQIIDKLEREIEELKKDRDFWVKEARDLETFLIRKFPGPFLEFEVHLAEHCNLNCMGCDHFSPLAKPAFPDFAHFKADMERMAEIFGDDVSSINLLGGEPLLNKDIIQFISCTRKCFPNVKRTKIRIVTNGILLPNMNNSFWDACYTEAIMIAITKYPINIDYPSIFSKAQLHSVQIGFYDEQTGEKELYRVPLQLKGNLDPKRSFYKCPSANVCCFLKQGKLYTCTLIPNIVHFCTYFNVDIKEEQDDYIDIYSDITKYEAFEKLARPTKFCRYCDTENKVYGLKWCRSSRNIKEWLVDEL